MRPMIVNEARGSRAFVEEEIGALNVALSMAIKRTTPSIVVVRGSEVKHSTGEMR